MTQEEINKLFRARLDSMDPEARAHLEKVARVLVAADDAAKALDVVQASYAECRQNEKRLIDSYDALQRDIEIACAKLEAADSLNLAP